MGSPKPTIRSLNLPIIRMVDKTMYGLLLRASVFISPFGQFLIEITPEKQVELTFVNEHKEINKPVLKEDNIPVPMQ